MVTAMVLRLAAVPLVVIAASAIGLGRAQLSLSGWGWIVLALALFVTSLKLQWRSACRVAVALTVLFAAARIARPASPEAHVETLHRDGRLTASPWLDRLFDERDAAIVGSRLMVALGHVRAPEFGRLPDVIGVGLDRLEAAPAPAGSPVLTTLLGLEGPGGSTTTIFEPRVGQASVGVVFLHGYGGNFAVQCAVIARALPEAVVVCPSTTFDGAWWSQDSRSIIEASRSALEARGVQRFVLAGISNGAAGVTVALPQLPGRFERAVLISGIAPAAAAPPIPTLVVQGSSDGMMRTKTVRAWARAHGVPVRELPGTHFVLLEQEPLVAEALHSFVFGAGRDLSAPADPIREWSRTATGHPLARPRRRSPR
jgi:pimeloyl-ACP methyl ester carboxylesterase